MHWFSWEHKGVILSLMSRMNLSFPFIYVNLDTKEEPHWTQHSIQDNIYALCNSKKFNMFRKLTFDTLVMSLMKKNVRAEKIVCSFEEKIATHCYNFSSFIWFLTLYFNIDILFQYLMSGL